MSCQRSSETRYKVTILYSDSLVQVGGLIQAYFSRPTRKKFDYDSRMTSRLSGTLASLLLLAVWVGADDVPLQDGVENGVMFPDMDTPLSPRSPRVDGRPTTARDYLPPGLSFLTLRQGAAAPKPDGSQPRDTSDGRRRASKWKGSRVVAWSKQMPNPQGFLALYG
ncbi:PREDICTED: uncharacterized protein LOC109475457 [Branchiostoma belcheri]|uniref:Uncharacterized protein LOC109475457 n=1 Tax=Branchiostoma belcheri TaxID=7741 RepID=A0A6P4ZPM4_BRABE|nr:PREDICTED: uncharacterized protein LOC109475457 [Branchiostoma belcheri]